MIKVIAFDFGGVLGSEANEWQTTFKEVIKPLNLSDNEIQEIWMNYWPKLKIGKVDIMDFWNAMSNKSSTDPKILRAIYNKSIRIDNSIFDIVKKLHEKYQLIILSNDSKDWMEAKLERFNFKDIFQKIYNSAEIGFPKPTKDIFDFVLKDQKIKPQELVFIDNQEKNLSTAANLGINAVLFTNRDNLIKQLSNLQIEI